MSDEGEKTCPLCAEEMDLTDQQLKPCKCGYEICVWCWHHIMDMAEKDDTEGRCPACRSPYDKEKIVGMAANCERLVAEVNMERKKSHKSKTKPSEGRKQLSSVRVIQRNLVYIVGLPLNLADEELLQRKEYFGQYGKVLKVSMSRTAAGVIQQFPNNTCSVYITYAKEEEAIRCIQSVHGFVLDGRSLKACFGTTKYCHAWLRNVPCTNPDCLYLHEIGSQEDSFTKDEIISAYTRSRVQQITGTTNNMLRRAGNMLPPPADDYCNNSSASAAKPIVKSTSNNAMSTGKGSPPNGISGKAAALPAAASWGMRASNQPQVASSAFSNGHSKPKADTVSSTLAFSSAVAITTQISTLHSDFGKKAVWDEESQATNGKFSTDSLKSVKQNNGVDYRLSASEKSVTSIATTATLDDLPLAPKSNEWGNTMIPNASNSVTNGGLSPDREKEDPFDDKIQNLLSDVSSVGVEVNSEHFMIPRSQGLQQTNDEEYGESVSSAVEKSSLLVNGMCTSGEQFDWRQDSETHAVRNTVSDLEDVISFDNQRLKDPEVVSRNSYPPNAANSIHISNHSRSHSLQQSEAFGGISLNPDSFFVDNRVVDRPYLHSSSNSVLSNNYPEKVIRSTSSDRNIDNSYMFPNEERNRMGRLQVDADSNPTLDGGESSIISSILSLDLDSWDEPLTSPQNLAKILGETDKQSSVQKMSGSWKAQNNHQSRFSFARQEESRHRAFDADTSFSPFGQLPRHQSFRQDCHENRSSLLDKLVINNNGFPPNNFEEPESFGSSAYSINKPSVSRAQFSAPPGFSVLNRAPPPGFSSHERVDQTFDSLSGNQLLDSSLLRNSYAALPTGNNISSSGDIEFMDPAILAVGKGRLQGGLSNPGLDMRSNFQQQLNAYENEARLQLLMQRSLSSHQNLRYADIGDNFSPLNDSYGISSRLMDQSQVNNLSPFAQLSLQQSRNGMMSNGHWDSWTEVQGGNNLGMAELLRNERLGGFNKFYAGSYEDSKFRMPNSGSLYNRTFEM